MFPFVDFNLEIGIIMTYIFVVLIALLIDIFTKLAAVKILMPINSVEIIKNILNFTYVENKGIAFGMFAGRRFLFIIMSLVILVMVLLVIFKTPKEARSIFLKVGGALVVSGAVGNLIDRVFKGYVVDFIELRFIDFPVFNVADIAVCIGAAMLIIHFLFFDGKNVNAAEEKDNE